MWPWIKNSFEFEIFKIFETIQEVFGHHFSAFLILWCTGENSLKLCSISCALSKNSKKRTSVEVQSILNAATIQFQLYFSYSIHSFIIVFWYFRLLPIQLKNVKRHNNAFKFKTTTTTEWKISRITAHQNFIVFVRVQSLVGYRGVLSFHRSSIALMQTLEFENGLGSHSLRPPIPWCLVLCLNHKMHIKTRPFCNINENKKQRARFITNFNWLLLVILNEVRCVAHILCSDDTKTA